MGLLLQGPLFKSDSFDLFQVVTPLSCYLSTAKSGLPCDDGILPTSLSRRASVLLLLGLGLGGKGLLSFMALRM